MAERIRALIVDDEQPARINLDRAITELAGWQVVGEVASARAARALLAAGPVDVVFVDVQMPFETGLSLARGLVEREPVPLLVFVTAFDRFAVDAFEVQALDYLLKPFDDARFALTIGRVEAALAMRRRAAYSLAVRDAVDEVEAAREERSSGFLQRFCVRSVGAMETVAVAAVQWISSAGNYVELHLPGRRVLHRATMSLLERRLDPAEFLRVHRTVLVRRSLPRALAVVGDGSYELTLTGGARVPVSERYVARVRELLAGP